MWISKHCPEECFKSMSLKQERCYSIVGILQGLLEGSSVLLRN